MDPVQNLPSQTPLTPITEENTHDESSNRWVNPLLIFLSVITIIVVASFGMLFFAKKSPINNSSQNVAISPAAARIPATITGTVYFQGYAPSGAYVAIAERSEGHGDFKDIISGLVPEQDGTTEWTWKDAMSGKNYEIKATLKVQGKVVQESVVQDVSAPATQVSLSIASTLQPPTPVAATMSGQINLDGYTPPGSTLQVLAKTVAAVSFQPVATGIAANDNANWTWGNAVSGTTYLIKAQLLDANNNVISKGDTQTITAPSGGEVLNVYSTANPPAATTSGISGTITINGAVPSGAYLTLATRVSGTTTFNQVASNMSASSGVGFSWSGANAGTSYDVQAYMWVNNQPYSQSNILTVTAPSTFDVLTINAQQPTQAPQSGSFNVSCGGTSGGLVQATINFNTSSNLSNAVSYNIVVTSASQNQQVVNTTVNPPNPTQSQSITTTYVFQPGATYYAQYAYATSAGGQMSALSPSVQFACQ
ncbi:MAG TPA: hypothetical protein VLB73_03315 [Patescibacteria group bacterium]|nr:hypothetical protein [Patescibacteria group bacterium]